MPGLYDDTIAKWDDATIKWDDVAGAPPATGLPAYRVELAFGADPRSRPTTGWTDVTSYCRGISARRGRAHELDRTQAGECTIRLTNKDRRFDPANTASPYYPNVRPMTQIRVQATFQSVTWGIFWGFVEDWGQTWEPRPINAGGDAEAVVRCVDAFKVFGLYELTPYSAVVLSDEPISYLRLNQGELPLLDEGSAGVTLSHSGAAIGPGLGTAPLVGGAPAMRFYGLGHVQDIAPSADLTITGDVTLEALVRIDPSLAPQGAVADTPQTIVRHGSATVADYELVWNIKSPLTQPGLSFRAESSSTTFPRDGAVTDGTVVVDANWHHIVGVRADRDLYLYKDGALLAHSRREASVKTPVNPILSIGDDATSFITSFVGDIAHVAVYDRALTADRIAAHYEAKFDTFVPQLSGTHINAVLDIIGWPVAGPGGDPARVIAAGASTIGMVTPSGNALDWMLRVAEDSDRGLLVVGNRGRIHFDDRHAMLLGNLTSAGSFGDSGTETVSYADLVIRNDDQDLYTSVQVGREGGSTRLVRDTAAEALYGPRTLDVSGSLVATNNETIDQADWLLSRYRAPHSRVTQLVGIPGFNATYINLVLALDCNHDRITVVRRPPGGGTIAGDYHIEGIETTIVPDFSMVTTYDLVPADTVIPLILDDTTYGRLDTATLGY